MRIEILGAHNTETDIARLPSVLVDDVLALDAGGLTASLPLKRQQQIKAVMLTHHHFDHCKDLIMLAANDSLPPSTIDVFGLSDTLETVYRYLLDGKLYRDYTQWPSAQIPRLVLKPVMPLQSLPVLHLSALPVPVSHSVPATGYLITAPNGKSVFYTGDTGPGLEECWKHAAPDLLVIEVTGLNRVEEGMIALRHMTPGLVARELAEFRKSRGYLPRVIVSHIPVAYEDEMRRELADAGKQLEMELEIGYEGLTIEV